MSKKSCSKSDGLDVKVKERKAKYYCKKCERQSPKEKWCCKPKEIKR